MDAPPGRLTRIVVVVLLLGAGFAAGWFTRTGADRSEARKLRVADAARDTTAGFEIELFARSAQHPAESTVCLLDGQPGMIVKSGTVYNRNSHVDFNHYTPGSFTAGIQGGDEGQVIDLGAAADLEHDLGAPPLAVLRWKGVALIAEGDEFAEPDEVPSRTLPTPVERARRWLSEVLHVPAIARKDQKDKSAQVKPGHVYFVRIVASRGPTEIVVLIHVLEYEVGKRVKLHCVQL